MTARTPGPSRPTIKLRPSDVWCLWLLAQRRAAQCYAVGRPDKLDRYSEALFNLYRHGRRYTGLETV